jgi:hypothetical protein
MAFWNRTYGEADLSTFKKLEGVGQQAYREWSKVAWEKQWANIKAGRPIPPPEITRLKPIVEQIEKRVRVKPLLSFTDNGDVYLHPELARELEKPENEALRFEVGDMGRSAARQRRSEHDHV